MPAPPLPADALVIACLAGGAAVRIGAATLALARGTLPDLPLRATIGIATALSIAALPTLAAVPTVARLSAGAAAGDWLQLPLVLGGEAVCGWALGMVAAVAIGIGGWSGSLLAGATSLGWDDDLPAGDPQSAGIARLGWWMGAAAFLATGGAGWLVAALLGSLTRFPVGAVAGGTAAPWSAVATDLAIRLPGAVLELAAGLALPALVAVIAFHLTMAICLRSIRFVPGPGLIPGLVAALVLASLMLTAPAWGSRSATAAATVLALVDGGSPAG
jgi:flagellar biosynthesis protein FliR